MKDYLEEQGIIINPVTPRNVIKEAFSANIIPDGQVWVDMILHRNLLYHTYDFTKFQEVLDAVVKRYLDAQEQWHEWFLTRQMQP
jgi:nucleotidyltransferase substrate binding protein (TIGR01987 family)